MTVAEKDAIALMKQNYGVDNISVLCLNNLSEKKIEVQNRTLVVLDEADYAIVDLKYKIEGGGFLLGLTATGLSAMIDSENTLLCGNMKMFSMSSGIESGVRKEDV